MEIKALFSKQEVSDLLGQSVRMITAMVEKGELKEVAGSITYESLKTIVSDEMIKSFGAKQDANVTQPEVQVSGEGVPELRIACQNYRDTIGLLKQQIAILREIADTIQAKYDLLVNQNKGKYDNIKVDEEMYSLMLDKRVREIRAERA